MTTSRSGHDLLGVLGELRKLPAETEWVEFKVNKADPTEIGEYISALSNSAALHGRAHGFIVWGVEDKTHAVIGTHFNPHTAKIGAEALESWLLRLLEPRIDFRIHSLVVDGNAVVILEVDPAFSSPVRFSGVEYIRIGSYKKKLKDFPEKERQLWRTFDRVPYERTVAEGDLSAEHITALLDFPAYFELLNHPLPEGRSGVLSALKQDGLVEVTENGKWSITKLGAILFARKLEDFPGLKRKSVRVIQYKGDSRVETIREQTDNRGYAVGFEGLVAFITQLLPTNEVIEKALRREVPMFPDLAIRELVANALIHQDFQLSGTGPTVELFDGRMEITNPGTSLVEPNRLLDSPPRSRNEQLASFMRRIGVCEERGSGVDKVVFETEYFQLPAPLFETTPQHTRATLFAHREFKDMDRSDRLRACYLHACLRYVQRDFMTNTTLRKRFGFRPENSAMASRIIRDTLDAGLIRCHDETVGNRARKYIPVWA